MTQARFAGFPEAALVFYEGLEADNSRPYWTDNKHIYEESVRAPMQALLDDLAAEFGEAKIFRPYRDVRYAADKTPYKTQAGAVVRGSSYHGLYVQLSADGLYVAGGLWHPLADQVARLRAAIADDRTGRDLIVVLDQLRCSGFDVGGERIISTPRGWAADHPRIELLRHKAVVAGRQWVPDDGLHDRRALHRVRKAWRALAPLNGWLTEHVGPTTTPEKRR